MDINKYHLFHNVRLQKSPTRPCGNSLQNSVVTTQCLISRGRIKKILSVWYCQHFSVSFPAREGRRRKIKMWCYTYDIEKDVDIIDKPMLVCCLNNQYLLSSQIKMSVYCYNFIAFLSVYGFSYIRFLYLFFYLGRA